MNDSAMTSEGSPDGELEALLEHGDWLRRLAWSLVRSSDDAQDLVQDTWIAAAASPPPKGVEPRSWLAGITRNLARNFQRKEARRRAYESVRRGRESEPGADQETQELEQQRRLITALLAIPESQRRAVVARYYDGLAPRKIAAREGAPVATVKSQIQRGLSALRKELDEAYGDRQAWSIALAPMAAKVGSLGGQVGGTVGGAATASGGPWWLGSKLVAAALAFVVAMAATVFFALSRPAVEPQTDALLAVESPAVTSPAPGSGLMELDRMAAAEANPSSRSAASGESTGADAEVAAPGQRLRVVARARGTGLGVPQFEGWAAHMRPILEAAAKRGEEIDTLDQLGALGEPIAWDAEGRASIRNAPPLLVYVAAADQAGIAMLEAPARDDDQVVVELVPAPPLSLRLVDRDGKVLDEDGLIRFEALLPRSGSGLLSAEGSLDTPGDYDWQPQAAALVSGLGEGRLVMNSANPNQVFEALRAVQTRAFHLAAPGVFEFGGDAVSFADSPLQPVPSGRREVSVLRPELGALEVRVVDGEGEPAPVSGTATFQFQSVPSGRRMKRFEAALVDGVARWPRVHAAGHALRVTVSVPTFGQTWTVDGSGPEADGATAVIVAQLPQVTGVQARLVDEEGRPLANQEARLVHGERPFHQALRFSSDAGGQVRFALPEGGLKDGPLLLEVFEKGAVLGFSQLDVAATVRTQGGDAGDWVVRCPESVVVQGRVETPEGEPHTRAYVSLTRGKHVGARDLVDARGEFRFEGVFDKQETFLVQLLRPDEGPFTADLSRRPDKEVPVRPYELAGPVIVRLEEARLGASVHARVDLTSFELEPEDVRISLESSSPGRRKELAWDASMQEYLALDVSEGTYSAHLRIRTSGPVASWAQIEVGASGAVRDPRLFDLRLADYLRPVTVRWRDPIDPETGQRRPLLDTEFREMSGDPARTEGPLITSGAAWPQLVPLDREGQLHVNAAGYRTLRIPLRDIKEIMEVQLERGIAVDVTLVGTAPRGARFGLHYLREQPSGAHVLEPDGPFLPLPKGLSAGDVWQARLPEAGRYQLWRHVGPPEGPPVSLQAWLSVDEPGAETDLAQPLELDLGASASAVEEASAK